MPEGQLQGVIDEVEHGGRAVANAAGAKKAKMMNIAESFIVVIEELGIQGAKSDAAITGVGVDFCIEQKELGR